MSVRWMSVQYVGSTLRLPIVSEGDFDKPIGSSRLERVVEKIEVRDVDGEEQAFVPESLLSEKDAENTKLRKLLANALMVGGFHGRQYLDSYLREEEGTTLFDELRAVGIEVDT